MRGWEVGGEHLRPTFLGSLIWETCGGTAVPSALPRRARPPFGCEEYEHNNECRAIEVIGQDSSSEVVALFLEDWELG